ncbi:hypothetical protein BT67DRAFT_438804 [Trichocladium antarcticum]|uniref:Uncharacterized protein n=1 Tax=Trichocladium antarcticum TaxID=1450529 RepID=A0AAN6UR69_9PEZI|nr:hypothetical protein BT67DRAFT_438804 [Trichocladium antarcticum]
MHINPVPTATPPGRKPAMMNRRRQGTPQSAANEGATVRRASTDGSSHLAKYWSTRGPSRTFEF